MAKTLFFTGHRPQGLYGFDNPKASEFKANIMLFMTNVITKAYTSGFTTFVTGGALGFDQYVLEVLVTLKQGILPGITNIVMRPTPSQHVKWTQASQEWYFKLLKLADQVQTIYDDPYSAGKMHGRNRAMINVSNAGVALLKDVNKGGTFNCFNDALKMGKPVFRINPFQKPLKGEWTFPF